MNNRLILILALLLMAFSETTLAQATGSSPAVSQVEILSAQLQTMREYQSQFISMAQWSLEAVFAIALALGAFGWHTNKVAYQRDRDALQHEVKLLRDELLALVTNEVLIKSSELQSALGERAVGIKDDIEKSLDKKLEKMSARVSVAHASLLDVQAELIGREAKESIQNKSYSWALYKYCELLDLCVKRQTDHYEASEILDSINKILVTPDFRLDADTITNTVEALKRLPQRYQVVADKLIRRINNE